MKLKKMYLVRMSRKATRSGSYRSCPQVSEVWGVRIGDKCFVRDSERGINDLRCVRRGQVFATESEAESAMKITPAFGANVWGQKVVQCKAYAGSDGALVSYDGRFDGVFKTESAAAAYVLLGIKSKRRDALKNLVSIDRSITRLKKSIQGSL